MRGKSKAGSPEPIEFKGTTLSVVSALLRSADPDILAASLKRMLDRTPDFFSGDAALIDLSAVQPQPASVDWPRLIELLKTCKLNPVAARVSAELAESALAAGLVVISESEARGLPKSEPEVPQVEPAVAPVVLEVAPPVAAIPEVLPAVEIVAAAASAVEAPVAPVAPPAAVPTMVVDRPLRSGQQVYARGGDLVVLGIVSAGAEVIADGSIHVYAPLRGRALAGARGNSSARIFTTSFEAELVSVAGVYKTFEQGIPARLARKPTQIRMDKNEQGESLVIEPLQIA